MTDVVFATATYLDVAAADADHRSVGDLDLPHGAAAPLEVVTIGRKATGEARLHRLGVHGDDHGGHVPAPGLAAGLAVVLYPSVAADAPVAARSDRAALQAIAGALASQLSRSDQMDLGVHLDPSQAALIASVAAELADDIRAVLDRAHSIRLTSVSLDITAIERAGTIARRIA